MSAMFAFEIGDVSMRSVTFERVMADVMRALPDPVDKEIVADAITVNCMWVDDIEPARKGNVLSTLYRVLGDQVASGMHNDNEVALIEIGAIRKELERRYPQYLV